MSTNAEQLWPDAETRNVQQHMRTLPTAYLILVNPLAFCQNLMNFSLHRVNKRSQNTLQNLLVTKASWFGHIYTYPIMSCVFHVYRFKISHRLWSTPCHDSYTFGLKDEKICEPLRQTLQPSMSNLIIWVISQFEVAANSEIKKINELVSSHLILNLG